MEEANFQEILKAAYAKRLRVAKRKHRFWSHPILNKRKEYGAFYHLVRELELDKEKYIEYFRMSPQQLDILLSYVGPLITKQRTVREPIDAKQRLAICLR